MVRRMSDIVKSHIKNDDRYKDWNWTYPLKQVNFNGVSFKNCSTDLNSSQIQFEECTFVGCDFSGLDHVCFFQARRCDFSNAIFHDVDLRHLGFGDCKFDQADFSSSHFWDADFSDWDLTSAKIDPVWKDLFEVLSLAIHEIPFLEDAIANGKINGSIYENPSSDCGCLNGTLLKAAKFSGGPVNSLLNARSIDRPIEIFCLNISPGDTPETNWRLRLILEKIQEFKASLSPAGS